MFRSILVPLDGGSFGECALPIARELGTRFGATLHLVHVHADVAFSSAMESLAFLGPSLHASSTAEEMAYLEGLADALTERGLHVETEVLVGARDDALEEYAQEHADLVVACTHAHQGLTRIWHRGFRERMVRDLGIPTLLVRVPTERKEAAIRHVLVPLSGLADAEDALLTAVLVARACGAAITLFHVVKPLVVVGYTLLGQNAHVNDFVLEDEVRRAESYLSQVAERLRAAGLRVRTEMVTAEEPAHAIEAAIRTSSVDGVGVDLVVLSTHGHTPIRRTVTVSVSDTLLHTSDVPILLHRGGVDPYAADPSRFAGSEAERT